MAVFPILFPTLGRYLPIKSGETWEVGVGGGFWPITPRCREHQNLFKGVEKLLANP